MNDKFKIITHFLNLPVKVAVGILVAILVVLLTVWSIMVYNQEFEDDFNAGYNSFFEMQTVDGVVDISGIDGYIYQHESNKTSFQYVCADQRAYERMLPIFGVDYVNYTCSAVGIPKL